MVAVMATPIEHVIRLGGRPRKDMSMTPAQLAYLIRTQGVQEVTKMVGTVPGKARAAVAEGYNLTRWEVQPGSGMALFTLYGSPPPPVTELEQRIVALEQERAALDQLDEPRVHLYQPEAMRRGRDAHMRANGLAAQIAALKEQLPEPEPRPAKAHVIWVNAHESERARWQAEAALWSGGAPTLIVFSGNRADPEADAFAAALDEATTEVYGDAPPRPAPKRRDPVADMLAAARGPRKGKRY